MAARALIIVSLATAVAASVAIPAAAKPKPKPLTKEYTASAMAPSPSNAVTNDVCSSTVAQSNFDEKFTAPFNGNLIVSMDGFQGDWDLALRDDDGTTLATSSQSIPGDAPDRAESIDRYHLRPKEAVAIRSCNFLGGPTAHVKYTFTAI